MKKGGAAESRPVSMSTHLAAAVFGLRLSENDAAVKRQCIG